MQPDFYKNLIDSLYDGVYFVDSTRAMQEAVRQGLKTHAAGMSMSVTGGEPVQWRVLSGEHRFVIDAASGRFVTREKD